jgi:hypothetical protein
MRQAVSSHLTYANVMATIAVFLVLGGGTAMAAYVVSSNNQIGPNTVSGHKPPSGDHSNVISGSLNGKDVANDGLGGAQVLERSLTGNVRKLLFPTTSASAPPTLTTLATVGPYAIKGACVAGLGSVFFELVANGPAGTADWMLNETDNDITDDGSRSDGLLIPANTDTRILDTSEYQFHHYTRASGTAMLKTGSTLVEVDFDAVADYRSFPGNCFMYGTATSAT